MLKNDFIAAVVEKGGYTKKDTTAIIKATFEVIAEAIANGDNGSIPDFGKFSAVEKPARNFKNPITGETKTLAAHRSPRFSASKALKESLL